MGGVLRYVNGEQVYTMSRLILFLFIISWLKGGLGLYFHIQETEQKCFMEEVPSETMIVGEFFG